MKQPEYCVVTDQITRRFGKFVAVDHISLQVPTGEIFGFLGANGAGKTTLIRILCGLLNPSSGEAWVSGFNVRTQNELIKQHIGYMSQKFSLYDDLQVYENLWFYGGIYGLYGKTLQDRADEMLQQMSLNEYRTMKTSSLPLGFKQRLALGCSLMHDPPVLFLDEPTSGVDPQVRRSFWDLIYQQAKAGKTVFVTTHFMDEAEYCHRVLIMQDGKNIALDSPRNLKNLLHKTSMQEVFLSLVYADQGKEASC